MALDKSIDFLKQIRLNNNREWMLDNKSSYQAAKDEFLEFAGKLLAKMQLVDEGLNGLDPKKCVFRINRDIRFSKDKSPYKTNFGMYLSEGGKNGGKAGYYLHLEPGDNSFLAGGIYAPDSEKLAKIRQEIDYNAAELKKIVDKKSFKALFGAVQGDGLKRAPKGYAEDHPNIELLKLKSFIVIHKLSDKEIHSISADKCVSVFSEIKPMNDYFNVAIS
ncbi:hypothetical protein C900_03514 [Fulvivirga imtechensis AK7]|uniref:TIGR02453 family protein n=1 Tax=Fulvivirga imtechensis AK7 TaxID=1237149 RepID=L8JP89_9BACT|nr:DUF2461 domain-containing protein [Fulvivirga imtechensis]ELR70741.1 hypothetical protein C900_03514 [Fulvivirga imtechensis AK7]